ncbi:MAG: hypothetical protein ACMXX9_01200 [Candidatus Woesearchaeota archaeon]
MEENNSKTIGILAVVFGVVSFIPLLGFFVGIAAIVLGIIAFKKYKNKLGIIGLVLGILGVLSTILLYGSLFYFGFVQSGGVYDDLRIRMVSEQNLPTTVNAIEAYKVRFGEYPESLENLSKISNDPFLVIDQIQMAKSMFRDNEGSSLTFYYQNNGDTYYLFSKGIDGIPFTDDDVFPVFRSDIGDIGYREPVYLYE